MPPSKGNGPHIDRAARPKLTDPCEFDYRLEPDLQREPVCGFEIRQIRIGIVEPREGRNRRRERDTEPGSQSFDVVAKVVAAPDEEEIIEPVLDSSVQPLVVVGRMAEFPGKEHLVLEALDDIDGCTHPEKDGKPRRLRPIDIVEFRTHVRNLHSDLQ